MSIAKAKIIEKFLLNFKNHDYAAQNHLGIMPDLGHILSEEDWESIRDSEIFMNIVFSPGVTSLVDHGIPKGAQLITIDYNSLVKLTIQERIAVVLHEIGHAFNPHLTGEKAEFIADDYAIDRGYGEHVKSSLEKLIKSNPREFDKTITRNRIERI